MPYIYSKPRYKRKPRKYAKKKKYSSKRTMVRYSRKSQMNKYYFKRGVPTTGFSGSDLAPAYLGSYTFQLSSISGASEFSVLFDQFRLNGVSLSFKLSVSPEAQTAANSTYPVIYWVFDNDDETPPTNLNTILEYSSYKKAVLRPNSWVNIWIKPAVLASMYETTLASAYSPKWKTWIDFTDIATKHFGLKFVVDGLFARYQVEVFQKFYFQCRKVR